MDQINNIIIMKANISKIVALNIMKGMLQIPLNDQFGFQAI